jgi:hypothetical protein
LLHSFRVLPLAKSANATHEIAVANNERMAYVYPLQARVTASLRAALLSEVRFDIVAWKEGEWAVAVQPGAQLTVRFTRAACGDRNALCDRFGAYWRVEGDLSVLDLTVRDGMLIDGDYPDGPARLYGALYSQKIPLFVVNARPRYEIHTRFFPRHKNGGAHGSLHRADTEVPLLVAGGPPNWAAAISAQASALQRIVDVKTFVISLFDASRTAQKGGNG